MIDRLVLSAPQLKPILALRSKRQAASISPDLGLSEVEVELRSRGLLFPDGQVLPWEAAEEIVEHPSACFLVEKGKSRPIQDFSEYTNLFYSLMPTEGAPTLNVSGRSMHRIKGITPDQDTLEKIQAVSPIRGPVLDTCTGLGYTAIEAAKRAEVVTIELDPVVLDIARLNPWSQLLFDDPRIEQVIGDVGEEVRNFEDERFGCVIHDPPTLSLAGNLYSGDFYSQLSRVLRAGGRLFHYVGDLASVSVANVAKGVIQRLREAGFTDVRPRPEAFGLTARRELTSRQFFTREVK
ncbi:MAG: spermine synthase [Chloroflexota bacterium]|nr:spermine synthase [Chloroflexota bacterium]